MRSLSQVQDLMAMQKGRLVGQWTHYQINSDCAPFFQFEQVAHKVDPHQV